MVQGSEPTHRPEDRTKKVFPYLTCQVFAVSNIRRTCVRKRVRPCAPRGIQKTLMTLGAVPRCIIWASNYPLGAKIWTRQQNTPDFTRIDEADFGEVLIGVTSSQEPFANKYCDAFAPRLVPQLVAAILSHSCKIGHHFSLYPSTSREKGKGGVQRGDSRGRVRCEEHESIRAQHAPANHSQDNGYVTTRQISVCPFPTVRQGMFPAVPQCTAKLSSVFRPRIPNSPPHLDRTTGRNTPPNVSCPVPNRRRKPREPPPPSCRTYSIHGGPKLFCFREGSPDH